MATEAPSTPLQVSQALSRALERLQDHVRFYAAAELDMVQKRHTADMVEAKAFLAATGSMEARRMAARVEAERAEFEALVAESVVRTQKVKIRAIEAEIDCARTFGATVRAEYQTMGYGARGRDGDGG